MQTSAQPSARAPSGAKAIEGALSRPFASGLALLGTAVADSRHAPGEAIYAEGDPADRIYEVATGLVRTVRTTWDGRRVVDDFLVPGDVFGLAGERAHASTAEAVTASRLRSCERASVERLALADPAASRALWSWLARAAERASERAGLLVHGDARAKVLGFLLQMADRLEADGRVELAMSRYDIADYMGLSSETVSRTFTALRARGVIALEGRKVVMLEPMARRRARSSEPSPRNREGA